MENNFTKKLLEKRPEYDIRIEPFVHPLDKKRDYITLYINNEPTKIVLDKSELESENPSAINELTDIVIDYIEKYNKE